MERTRHERASLLRCVGEPLKRNVISLPLRRIIVGAWGSDSFENDDAADWVADFCDAPDQALVVSTLSAVAEMDAGEYLEAPDCSVGIAAAEIVAALKAAPNTNLPDETKSCFSRLEFKADPSLVILALKAMKRIRTNSELKELWDEAETPAEWYTRLDDLEERLRR